MGWQGPLTNRQLQAWRLFLRDEQTRPGLTDLYLMQIAQKIHNIGCFVGVYKDLCHDLRGMELKPKDPEGGPTKQELEAGQKAMITGFIKGVKPHNPSR